MRALLLAAAFAALGGCADFPWGPGLGACEAKPGASGASVGVLVIWNETTSLGNAGEPARGACVHAFPSSAPEGSGDLSREARVDDAGRATLRLDPALPWRVYALVETPRDRYCAFTSESAEVHPAAQATWMLHVTTGKLCA